MLDLFSGSGLMAVEALSRGVATVTSIEKNRRIVNALKAMRSTLSLDERWRLLCGDVQSELDRLRGQRFDLVFADPPYATGIGERLPAWLDAAGVGCGLLIVEESSRVGPTWPAGWTQRQARRYGETCLYFLDTEGT